MSVHTEHLASLKEEDRTFVKGLETTYMSFDVVLMERRNEETFILQMEHYFHIIIVTKIILQDKPIFV